MAANDNISLRYTTEIPLIETAIGIADGSQRRSQLTNSTIKRLGVNMGNMAEIEEKLQMLLTIALERQQQSRVEYILSLTQKLEAVKQEVEKKLGRKVKPEEMKVGFEAINQTPDELAKLAGSSSGSDSDSSYFTSSSSDSDSDSSFFSSSSSDDDSNDDMDNLRGKPKFKTSTSSNNNNKNSSSSSSSSSATSTSSSSSSVAKKVEEAADVECVICFDDFKPSEMRGLLGCDHLYCFECLDHHLSSKINEGDIDEVKCPSPDCDAKAEEYEVESLVNAETYQKYLQFLALSGLKNDKNTCWCPNKECREAIIWDMNQQKVTCPSCKHEFCFSCKSDWHEGKLCAEVTDIKIEDAEMKKYLSSKGVKVKPCPKCNIQVEKNSGCNHMTCVSCKHQYCWLCLKDYGARHYTEGDCQGLQFTQADTLEAARKIAPRTRTRRTARVNNYNTPAARRRRRRRKRKKIARNVALGVVAAPVVVVGGAVIVAATVVALPFAVLFG